MIYFFGIVSGILFLIFIAIYAMIEMHINYKKSIPKLQKFTRVNPDGTISTYYLRVDKKMVITMIDIIAALIGFGAVLIFPFVTIQFLYETYEDIFKDD